MCNHFNFFLFGLWFIAFFSFLPSGFSADSYSVNFGSTLSIHGHNHCRKITNNHISGNTIFVPTKTAAEWASFYNNLPTGVVEASCNPSNPIVLDAITVSSTGGSLTSNSVAPTSQSLLIAIVSTGHAAVHTHTGVTSTFATVGGWIQRASAQANHTNAVTHSIYTAIATGAPGSGTVTANFSTNVVRRGLVVLAVTAFFDPSIPIAQSTQNSTVNSSQNSVTTTFSSAPITTSLIINSVTSREGTSVGHDAVNSFTELSDIQSGGVPQMVTGVQYKNQNVLTSQTYSSTAPNGQRSLSSCSIEISGAPN